MGHYDDFYEAEEEKYRRSPAGKKAAAREKRLRELDKIIKQKYPEIWEYQQLKKEV